MGLFHDDDDGNETPEAQPETLTGDGTQRKQYKAHVAVLGLAAGRSGFLDPANPEVQANVANGNLDEIGDGDSG